MFYLNALLISNKPLVIDLRIYSSKLIYDLSPEKSRYYNDRESPERSQ